MQCVKIWVQMILNFGGSVRGKKLRANLVRLWIATKPANKLKIMIGLYQIVTKIEVVYEVSMPQAVRQMLSLFSIAVSMGLGNITSTLTCLGVYGFLRRRASRISIL